MRVSLSDILKLETDARIFVITKRSLRPTRQEFETSASSAFGLGVTYSDISQTPVI